MKVETVEEFLARGGVIQKIPTKERETDKTFTVRVSSPRIMSLDEGEFYFTPPPKDKIAVKLDDVLDKFKLPTDVIERLKKK